MDVGSSQKLVVASTMTYNITWAHLSLNDAVLEAGVMVEAANPHGLLQHKSILCV
jgi:hypothetical protein